MSARQYTNPSHMRTNGQVPLRFLHSLSANFTLPIQRKPLAAALLPFSLKKLSATSEKPELEQPQMH